MLSVEKLTSRFQVNFGGMKAGINWNGRQIAVADVVGGSFKLRKKTLMDLSKKSGN